jgi:hypothetical protein
MNIMKVSVAVCPGEGTAAAMWRIKGCVLRDWM